MIYKRLYSSPIGELIISVDGEKLFSIELENDNNRLEFVLLIELQIFNEVFAWLDDYFNGIEPKQNIEYMLIGTKFQLDVWKIVSSIPYGQTITYGDIAKQIAKQYGVSRMSPQAVGTAVSRNPIPIIIPCHRVVSSKGIGGYSLGIDIKKKLMKIENIS